MSSLDYIFSGFSTALRLLAAGDAETFSAVLTTIKLSSLSMLASADPTLVSEKTGLDPDEASSLVERAKEARRKSVKTDRDS